MPESIAQRVNASGLDAQSARELNTLLQSLRTDINNVATQFNQLRTDYNANANVGTDTTATAVTLNTNA